MTVKHLIQMLEQCPQNLQVGIYAQVPASDGAHEYREIVGLTHVQVDKHGKPDFEFLRAVLWGDSDSTVW